MLPAFHLNMSLVDIVVRSLLKRHGPVSEIDGKIVYFMHKNSNFLVCFMRLT